MNTLSPNRTASIVYNTLLSAFWLGEYQFTARLWQFLWTKSRDLFSGPVQTAIHGRQIILNYGHLYALFARKFPHLNNPIKELVYQAHRADRTAITFVDVGANIGDTVLLLEENCPGMVGNYYCIDGDREFFAYLQYNLSHLEHVQLYPTMLSSREDSAKELVRTHGGTSSAQGQRQIASSTLDSLLLKENIERLDIVKIDVDGYDGRVLMGAKGIIQKHHPSIIFEWHPILCNKTRNNWTEHFEVLESEGYRRYIWFTKYGDFSHFMEGYDQKSLNMLAEFCLNSQTLYDWHYDVIALHEFSAISPMDLADLRFALGRKMHF